MSDYGVGGPDWFWRLLGILIFIGLFAVVIGAVMGIIWLFKHVQFV